MIIMIISLSEKKKKNPITVLLLSRVWYHNTITISKPHSILMNFVYFIKTGLPVTILNITALSNISFATILRNIFAKQKSILLSFSVNWETLFFSCHMHSVLLPISWCASFHQLRVYLTPWEKFICSTEICIFCFNSAILKSIIKWC